MVRIHRQLLTISSLIKEVGKVYDYKAIALRVIDGDTIDFYVDLGFRLTTVQRVRILGCDCPELNRKETYDDGLRAMNAVKLWLSNNPEVRIVTSKSDVFGRWLANIFRLDDEVSLTQFLITNGYAVPRNEKIR